VWLDGAQIGVLGELHPRWRQQWELPGAPLLFELDLDAVLARRLPAFEVVPRVQPSERDIAVIVADSVTHDDLMSAVRAADTGGLLQGAFLFDVYKPAQAVPGLGANEKSLAVRLTLGRTASTLTDEEIETAVKAVVARMASKLDARLRT
jgi:phenylalanyl-tRNA synthetase beta chain